MTDYAQCCLKVRLGFLPTAHTLGAASDFLSLFHVAGGNHAKARFSHISRAMAHDLFSGEQVTYAMLGSNLPLNPPAAEPEVDMCAETMQERLTLASNDIRNALVPLQTIAELLRQHADEKTQDWCARMLRREVRHIVGIIEDLTT